MLDALITSKTRIKILLKFFLNSNASAYLRSLESEFGESTNAIRVELNRFEQAGLLTTYTEGNKKMFRANIKHPMFFDIRNILHKYLGIDKIIDKVISRLGKIESVYVTGSFACGTDSPVIDLLFVASDIDRNYLSNLVAKTEKIIARSIRYVIMTPAEIEKYQDKRPNNEKFLLIWNRNGKNKS